MSSNAIGFARGIAFGMAAGTLVGTFLKPASKHRKTAKTVKAVGKMVENIAQSVLG